MRICTKDIICNNELLTLTNQRVVYWPKHDVLILSDLHIGKTAHFRKSGIPVPLNVLEKDLERLKSLILHFNPKQLLIVGDLFHAELNQDVMLFKVWMQQFRALNIILVKGNHDKHVFDLYENLNIEILPNQLQLEPITFIHNISNLKDETFYISGHTHPGVLIKGKGRQKIKLPCFQVSKQQLILPAFSLFTGLNTNNAPKFCVNYAFTDAQIFEV